MGNLVWLSCVVVPVLIGITCDWVSCWAGWSSMISAGTGCLCSMWSRIFQHTTPACSCLDRVLRERVGVCKASWSLGLEPAHRHVYILLAKASHNASPDSNGGEVDSTSLFSFKNHFIVKSLKHIQKRRAHEARCVHHPDSTVTNSWLILFYLFLYL